VNQRLTLLTRLHMPQLVNYHASAAHDGGLNEMRHSAECTAGASWHEVQRPAGRHLVLRRGALHHGVRRLPVSAAFVHTPLTACPAATICGPCRPLGAAYFVWCCDPPCAGQRSPVHTPCMAAAGCGACCIICRSLPQPPQEPHACCCSVVQTLRLTGCLCSCEISLSCNTA
jgi:hypothetical protein